jgi:hypothetical protein
MTSSGMTESEALASLNRQITSQGFIFSAAEIFQLCAYAFLAMIVLTWFAKARKRV